MSKFKFKVGQRVKVLDDNAADVVVGDIYTINRIEVEDSLISYVIRDDGLDWYFGDEHLEDATDIGVSLATPAPRTNTVRGDVLLEAKSLIEGDRNITYGEPTENFKNIAGMWNILFAHKLTEDFTPRDIAQAMIALKQCRTITQPKRDNFVDIAGYAAIGWEAEQANAEPTV